MKSTKLVATFGGMLALAACAGAPQEGAPCEEPCCDEPCGPQHAPLGWEGPVLLWSGPAEVEPPACPEEAPEIRFEGFDGLSVTQSCPSCSCSAPACRPSAGVLAWDAPWCGEDPSAPTMTWRTPEEWDGSCIHADPIIPSEVATSTIILATRRAPCAPIIGPEPRVAEASWSSRARACAVREGRAAIKPPPRGFGRCVAQGGEVSECPAAYPERRIFYGGVAGDLGCTPCSCGEPTEGGCRYDTTIYREPGCTWQGFLMNIDTDSAACAGWGNQVSNAPVVSMDSTFVAEEEPGSCAPAGGAPVGAAWPVEPTTLCCEQPW